MRINKKTVEFGVAIAYVVSQVAVISANSWLAAKKLKEVNQSKAEELDDNVVEIVADKPKKN